MEETRRLNIQRNDAFLKLIMGNLETLCPVARPATQEKTLENKDEWVKRRRAAEEVKASIQQQFPFREAEINEFYGYLNEAFIGSPALVNIGPSGCGKSAICIAALRGLGLPHAVVGCGGCANPRQLYCALWQGLRLGLGQGQGLGQEQERARKKRVEEVLGRYGKPPSKFADFAYALGRVAHAFFSSGQEGQGQGQGQGEQGQGGQDGYESPSSSSPSASAPPAPSLRSCFHLVLDDFDSVYVLDSDLAVLLLQLTKHSHFRVKVIANLQRESPLSPLQQAHATIRFAPYCEKQLGILLGNCMSARLYQHMCLHQQQQRGADVQGAVGAGAVTTAAGAAVIAGSAAAVGAVGAVLLSYNHLVRAALPALLCGARHPQVLLDATSTVWTALHRCTPQDCCSLIAADGASGGATSAGAAAGGAVALRALYLPAPSSSAVRDAVKLAQHLPAFSYNSADLCKLSSSGGSSSGSGGSGGIRVVAPSAALMALLQSQGQGQGQTDERRGGRQVSEASKLDSDWMRMRVWASNMPTRTRYLLLAAFLAGVNPKESDNLKLTGGRDQRRKKQRLGCDGDPDLKVGAGAAGLQGSRWFSLERLTSIYTQIVGIVTHRPAVGCGDAGMYAALRSLVQKRLLTETESAGEAVFLSYVSRDAADLVAGSVGFHLPDFLYHNPQNALL